MPEPHDSNKVKRPPLSGSTPRQHRPEEETDPQRQTSINVDDVDLGQVLAPPQAPDEMGRLAHYRILKQLGHGGMGVVLLAEDANLQRLTALKVMLPHHARVPVARERFLREARSAAKIKHDNVVTIFQVAEERGVPFIAMELLKGASLESYLEKKGELSIGQVLRIAREIVDGLTAAHAAGLIHRDIKPANLWLEPPRGRIKILDFGLARQEQDNAGMTQSGAVLGTPKYMSPEQAAGETADARSDLFSVGVVLYRLCTGREPFRGSTMMKVLDAVRFEQQVPARQLNQAVPVQLERLIERLLAKEREERVQTAEEATAALSAVKKALAGGASKGSAGTLPLTDSKLHRAHQRSHDDEEGVVHELPAETMMEPVRRRSDSRGALSSSKSKTVRRRKSKGNSAMLIGIVVGVLVLLIGGFFIIRALKDRGKPDARPADATVKEKKSSDSPASLVAPFSATEAAQARTAWAKHLGIPERKDIDLGKGIRLELVLIPPGEYRMGSPVSESARDIEREKLHRVVISKPFYMAVTETTQEQYEAVMNGNPSYHTNEIAQLDTAQFPVENVSWERADEFCEKIGARLPTEAQWEYACRAGTTTVFHFGDVLNGNDANCDGRYPYGTDPGGFLKRTERVKQYAANAFGLYDMHGNVWEWCRDYYATQTDDLAVIDPERSSQSGDVGRVLRGGGWTSSPRFCRSADRDVLAPDVPVYDFGFRIIVLP